MSIKLKKFIEWMESDEGKAESDRVLAAIELERKIHSERLRKLTYYLKMHSFDELIARLIKEHDEAYRTKCYDIKRCEPYPNNKLSMLLSYVEKHGTEMKHIKGITDGMFSESLYKFKGYYFLTVCGQGCFNRIFNKNKEMILQV